MNMVSKEEIGLKHGLAMHDPIQKYHISNAMDEYAKQVTIDFLKWAHKDHQYYVSATGGEDIWMPRVRHEGVPPRLITNEELFNTYIEQSNQH